MTTLPDHNRGGRTTGSSFRQRLFHYVIGLAIGFMIVGAIHSARTRQMKAQHAADEAARQAATDQPDPPSAGDAPTPTNSP